MKRMKKLLRTAAERLLRNKSFVRRFPKEFGGGRICVSPDASLKLLKYRTAFDPMLLRFADHHISEGDCGWDIGANLGVCSLAACHKSKSGQVVSIDPDPFLCDLIRRTAAFSENSDFDWLVCCVAISSQAGITDLKIAKRGRATNAIGDATGSSQMGGVRHTISIPTLSLDDMRNSFGLPDVIKIDTEGAEHLVLEGGRRLLEERAPVLLIEVSGKNREWVSSFLNSMGYRFHDAEADLWPSERLKLCATNTIAIPAWRSDYD